MKLVFKIAWRNIWRHKGRSLVIGLILFVGAFLMTIGNSVISGMEFGLFENIVNTFTGDIVLISDSQEDDDILLDLTAGKNLEILADYEKIEEILDEENAVADYLPLTGGTMVILDEEASMHYQMFLGVDIKKYQSFFPDNFKVVEGRGLSKGERGMLLPSESRTKIYNFMNFWVTSDEKGNEKVLEVGNESSGNVGLRHELIIMGMSDTNSVVDIKVPVIGVIDYNALNKIWGNYALIDIESFREAHHYVTGRDKLVEIPEETKALLSGRNFDFYFMDDVVEEYSAEEEVVNEVPTEVINEDHIVDIDSGVFNLVFIRKATDISLNETITKLNNIFEAENLNVRAVSWQSAIGFVGSIAILIKGALNLFIMCLFFVAIIMIMNTLSMATIERTSEIAMMRAIGSRKSFLKNMYISETGFLSFFFGGIGILLGIIVVNLIKLADITTTNEWVEIVYGGTKFNPMFTGMDFLLVALGLLVVTLLSVIHPLNIVSKIVPLDAIKRN